MTSSENMYAPAKRDYIPNLKNEERSSKESIFSIDFFCCLFSLCMLVVSGSVGTLAIIGFLAPWPLIVTKNFARARLAFMRNWQLFLVPILALLSTTWSDDPSWTLRGSVEFIITVAISILAGACISRQSFMTALLSALLLGGVLSLFIGQVEIISYTGEVAFAGIFGSKNAFSGAMSLLALSALAIYLDNNQSKIFRSEALCALIVTPYLLYHGRSFGTVVAVCFTLMIMAALNFLKRFDPTIRRTVCVLIFVTTVLLLLFVYVSDINLLGGLNQVGKDATLTGRTWLWSHAFKYIADRPILGNGYEAFWRVSNPRAQELWYGFHVPAGAGLGFHNEYIQITIDLGIIGLSIALWYFYTLIKRTMKLSFASMITADQIFSVSWFLFFIIRTPIETGLFGQFSINTIIFGVVWIYTKPANKVKKLHKSILNQPRIFPTAFHK